MHEFYTNFENHKLTYYMKDGKLNNLYSYCGLYTLFQNFTDGMMEQHYLSRDTLEFFSCFQNIKPTETKTNFIEDIKISLKFHNKISDIARNRKCSYNESKNKFDKDCIDRKSVV